MTKHHTRGADLASIKPQMMGAISLYACKILKKLSVYIFFIHPLHRSLLEHPYPCNIKVFSPPHNKQSLNFEYHMHWVTDLSLISVAITEL